MALNGQKDCLSHTHLTLWGKTPVPIHSLTINSFMHLREHGPNKFKALHETSQAALSPANMPTRAIFPPLVDYEHVFTHYN